MEGSEANLEARYRHHKSRHEKYKAKYMRARQAWWWLSLAVLLLSIASIAALNLRLAHRKTQDQMIEVLIDNSRLRQELSRREQTIANLQSRLRSSQPRTLDSAALVSDPSR